MNLEKTLWLKITLFALLGVMTSCASGEILPESTAAPAMETPFNAENFLQIFFIDPGNPSATPLDEWLVQQIDGAQESVELAIYNLSLENVTNALIRANQRGVEVRVVMESTAMDRTQPERLAQAGVEVVGDRRESLMHHKFLVIDRALVCVSSFNYTATGIYSDNNNLVCIQSDKAAQDFITEFEEMFVQDVFGENLLDTPYPFISLDELTLEVYFLPDDGVSQRIVELIDQAQQSISFMVYSFTSDDIGEALRQRAAEGIDVRGVIDASRGLEENGAEYNTFQQAGMNVRLDGNPDLMHHKVLIIDGEIVVTGSYNFTRSAEESNDENCLILHDEGAAQQFEEEFERVYSRGN